MLVVFFSFQKNRIFARPKIYYSTFNFNSKNMKKKMLSHCNGSRRTAFINRCLGRESPLWMVREPGGATAGQRGYLCL